MTRFAFRMTIAALAIVGVLIIGFSLHGRHRIPRDTDVLPTVPSVGEAPRAR